MNVIAYITEAAVLATILAHLGLPTEPVQLAPARRSEQLELFEQEWSGGGKRSTISDGEQLGARGPPQASTTGSADYTIVYEPDETNNDDWAA